MIRYRCKRAPLLRLAISYSKVDRNRHKKTRNGANRCGFSVPLRVASTCSREFLALARPGPRGSLC